MEGGLIVTVRLLFSYGVSAGKLNRVGLADVGGAAHVTISAL